MKVVKVVNTKVTWPLVTRKSLQSTLESFITSKDSRLWVHGVEGTGARTAFQQTCRNKDLPVAYFDFRQEGAVNDRIIRERLLDEIIPQIARWSGAKADILPSLRACFDVDQEILSLKRQILDGWRPEKVELTPLSQQNLRSAQTPDEIWNQLTEGLSDYRVLHLVASLNATQALPYVLRAASLSGSFFFISVDELFRSPFYSDGKQIFDDLDTCAKAVYHTSDALTFIGCRSDFPATTIDEWPEDLARSVAEKTIKNLDDDVWKGVYAGVGGHPAHLHRTVEGMHTANRAPQLKPKTHAPDVVISDELKHELEADDTLMSLHDVSPLEKYLRNDHVRYIDKDIGKIEWQITQFEANSIVEQATIWNKVQLWEGIRHICGKPYLPVPMDFNIKHDHVNALLDANLLVPKLNPSRIVVANVLTRKALLAHCTMKYEELSLVDRLEYNLHVWKHRQDMVYCLDHLAH